MKNGMKIVGTVLAGTLIFEQVHAKPPEEPPPKPDHAEDGPLVPEHTYVVPVGFNASTNTATNRGPRHWIHSNDWMHAKTE